MTNPIPNNIKKEFSSLAIYIQGTRRQLLNILAYIEGLKKKFLFYQLATSQNLSRAKAQEILTELKEWPREIRTRTERADYDFQEEQRIIAGNFPALLNEQLETVAFLFSRLLEKSNGRTSSEESIHHFEQQIFLLQQEPNSKEVIKQVTEALENVHHVFVRLLDAVHKEENELLEEAEIVDQIGSNTVVEENQKKILETVREVFNGFLENYPRLKYGALLYPTITAKIRKEMVDHRQTTYLTISITLTGRADHPSWEGHLRYDAKGHFFEAVFGRRGLQFIPEEHRSYVTTTQMLREFPTRFIQYIFNSEVMREMIKKEK